MNRCGYTRTAEIERATGAVQGNPRAMFLAGGTTLVDLMKEDVLHPEELVDINHLPLDEVERLPNGGMRIGALVRNSQLADHPEVRRVYPVLSEALLSGASTQIRNMATTGGNLLQRTRCPYFRQPASACNKREPGTGCSALEGDNRRAAILGTSRQCVAAYPGDMAVALMALEAVLLLERGSRQRRVPLADFYLLPEESPDHETVLAHGELIRAVELPPLKARSHYLKVRDRASYDFALASAAVVLEVKAGTIGLARIALGGVGTRPWRCAEAERVLLGHRPGKSLFQEAARVALQGATPLRDNAFKVELSRRILVRALEVVA